MSTRLITYKQFPSLLCSVLFRSHPPLITQWVINVYLISLKLCFMTGHAPLILLANNMSPTSPLTNEKNYIV